MSLYLRRGDLARAALAGALCFAPDNGAGSGGPGGAGSGQGGAQGATGSGGAGGAQGGAGGGSDDAAGGDDGELRRVRREAQGLRARVRELEEAAQAAQTAGLSEVDKLKALVAKLEKSSADAQTELRKERTRAKLAEVAGAKGLNAKLAERLLATETIEYDADGQPMGLDRVLDKLAQDFPVLATGTTQAGANAGGNAQGQASASVGNPAADRSRGSLTLDMIRAMTPDQINARWDEVSRALTQST